MEDLQRGNTFIIYQNGLLVICRALLNSSLNPPPPTSKILLLRQDAPLNFDLLLSALCLGRGGGGGRKDPKHSELTLIQPVNNNMNIKGLCGQYIFWMSNRRGMLREAWGRVHVKESHWTHCVAHLKFSYTHTHTHTHGTSHAEDLISLFCWWATRQTPSSIFLATLCLSFPRNLPQQMDTILLNQFPAG